MTPRIRILGIALAVVGLLFVAGGTFAFIKAQEGSASLQAFSEKQNVKLAYNDKGQLVDGGETAGADAIMALLVDDWRYPVVKSDFDPKDPLVNTASEYMYQMAMISYHVMEGTQTVVLTEDKEYKGKTYPAGTYEFKVDGRYYADFDRAHPIEGPARTQAWSPLALGLIGQLGVGTATASALQMALGLAILFAGVGFVTLLIGLGLVWVSRQPLPVPAEAVRSATVASPAGAGLPALATGR